MFSDLVNSKKKKPNTEHTEKLYNGEVSVQDISVKEATKMAEFYDMSLPFFVNVCTLEHPSNDLNVLQERIDEGKKRLGENKYIASCIKKQVVEIYWYLGFFTGSYRYLDEIDEFCEACGIDKVSAYNKIRQSDRSLVPERI